jgi:hypothetical protein
MFSSRSVVALLKGWEHGVIWRFFMWHVLSLVGPRSKNQE